MLRLPYLTSSTSPLGSALSADFTTTSEGRLSKEFCCHVETSSYSVLDETGRSGPSVGVSGSAVTDVEYTEQRRHRQTTYYGAYRVDVCSEPAAAEEEDEDCVTVGTGDGEEPT